MRCKKIKFRVSYNDAEEKELFVFTEIFNRFQSKNIKRPKTIFNEDKSRENKPALKGSLLYTIFGIQASISILIGGLLAYNIIYPSDQPSIARLIGMWSVWLFAVPSLRARDCSAREKSVLNLLFVLIPLLNILIPFVWKSFAGIFNLDLLLLIFFYANKNVLPFGEEDEDL